MKAWAVVHFLALVVALLILADAFDFDPGVMALGLAAQASARLAYHEWEH